MPTTLPTLNTCEREAFVAAVGPLFERSPWLAEEAFSRRPFRDARHLHAELCAGLEAADGERQLELIRAHPDLAGRLAQNAQNGELTAASAEEQASAGLDRLSASESAELAALNERYRQRFGFPFVICARLNDKSAILAALEHRLENSRESERATALEEIEKIAWLRLERLLEA